MVRSVILTLVVLLSGVAGGLIAADVPGAGSLPAAEPYADTTPKAIDGWVALFNPDVRARVRNAAGKEVPFKVESTFTAPASDLASEVVSSFWLSFWFFLPFLILPQVLLVYVIFKFKKRDDGRKPATFIHHNGLEIAWTLIPVLTLIVVGIPVYPLLVKMDGPPPQVDLAITVRASQFKFDYDYKRENIQVGLDLVGGYQEPMVLMKDRTVALAVTSNDVNHAWWIPAFGVKKDAIIGRFNQCWFTPTRVGTFKGQCAELCGRDHGRMFVSAVVVEPERFEVWKTLQRQRADVAKVWAAVLAANAASDAPLKLAVDKYLDKAKGDADEQRRRVFALKFWIASNFTAKRIAGVDSATELPEYQALHGKAGDQPDPTRKTGAEVKRGYLEQVISAGLAALPAAESAVAVRSTP